MPLPRIWRTTLKKDLLSTTSNLMKFLLFWKSNQFEKGLGFGQKKKFLNTQTEKDALWVFLG